ncbi:efflux RND transporter permease subunit [Kozakia baliensis]|uniref:efflux RND transporter permease subunit n=1 Tax=Kozakia baliensis TaxID=153496 RepID=UPI00087CDDC0|nr:efflux RND transporter permease subunit [Kozakia baliensis]AOX20932.1 nodulation protein [Kozakia baliensis]
MNFCRLFILRPVATTLLALSLLATGLICYPLLPVANTPDVSSSTINVEVSQPGASPQQMASSVTTPLERFLGQIADVSTIESDTENGNAFIRIDFASSRNIDGALRDVQAAMRAARADLPQGTLDSDPVAYKEDPTAQPIYLMSLTSDTIPMPRLFDIAQTRVRPLLAQIKGVGHVEVVGSAQPAVRVDINPLSLYKWGIGFEDVRQALASANANTPKGFVEMGDQRFMLATNDQATEADQYRDLIIGYRNNLNPVRLSSVAKVSDSVQDIYQAGYFNNHPAITLIVRGQPKSNTVRIVDGIEQRMGLLRAVLPGGVQMDTAIDLSASIRASLADTQLTLGVSVLLVVGVILVFLRRIRSTLIPAVTVPVALIGTLAVMKMMGFTLDILSLMALTIAVGFVVDDAIVVLENIARHMEEGMDRMSASLKGSAEIGFTVLSITASLIAVFVPIMFLPGMAGAFFFEFAMTIVSALVISLILSLTLTPMMCAYWLDVAHDQETDPRWTARLSRGIEKGLQAIVSTYGWTLRWGLKHHIIVVLTLPLSFLVLVGSIVLMPKTGIPAQDISLVGGFISGDDTMSFAELSERLKQVGRVVKNDPDVRTVTSFNSSNSDGQLFASLTDKWTRRPVDEVVDRIRTKLGAVPGMRVSFFSAGDPNGGGGQRRSGAYRYVLRAQNPDDLTHYVPKLITALRKKKMMTMVTSNIEGHGAAVHVELQRDTEARYLVTPQLVGNVLYDAYGQTVASRIHTDITTHSVVMEVAAAYRQSPDMLKTAWVSTSSGTPSGATRSNQIRTSSSSSSANTAAALSAASLRNAIANQITGNNSNGAAVASAVETMVPLTNVADLVMKPTPMEIDHHNGLTSTAISFDLAPGNTYEDARKLIEQTMRETNAPIGVGGNFSGLAGETQKLLVNELLAFVAALAAMYIVLGILYESLIHPITILSTLPSAGIGAILGLWVCGEDFSLIAMIGMILLTGIVKKNAILMIDFALHAENNLGYTPREAIYEACLTRFRPILMTTLAAALGAVPLMLGHGYGSEMRRPLGIAIVGGMMLSQLLTLYTTPVIYLYMDAIGRFGTRMWQRVMPHTRSATPPAYPSSN